MDDAAAERAYPTPYANSPLLPLLLLSLSTQKHSPDTKNEVRGEYDYIVVGAGSAGSVVASRLSEVDCVSVLLLEAGKAPPRLTEVPGIYMSLRNTDIDWKYKTEVQRYGAQGLIDKKVPVTLGKMLGGSSCLNGMDYVRGNRRDYDNWAERGAVGWDFRNVLPYFKKMEDNTNPEVVKNGYHGVGGPVTVSSVSYKAEIKDPLFEAFQEVAGLKKVDSNGPKQVGANDRQLTARNGQRCSTAKAYLVPKENADNLDIVKNSLVTKIDFNDKRAVGVWFDMGEERKYVRARQEVILSAGSINTPKLLMLSGIGPAEHLESLGIPVVADLPVGFNLHDHVTSTVHFEIDSSIEPYDEKLQNRKNLMDYIDSRTGPLTENGGIVMQAFENYEMFYPTADFPTIQLLLFERFNMKGVVTSEIYDQVYAPYENHTVAACYPVVMQPKSRGRVMLRSDNPYDPPIIDNQYLQESFDLDRLVEGMQLCSRIIASDAMRAVSAKPLSTPFPGCENFARDEALYFRCVARLICSSAYHNAGTAKMGDPQDDTTVVDTHLRVRDVRGLRIVDASVMPTLPSGNTNVPTIMIAEKASDLIKEDIICDEK